MYCQVQLCLPCPAMLLCQSIFLRAACFVEYVADKTGYELIDMAVGSSTTNKTTSFHGVGDFYPSSLLSNKRGARNVTLPTFNEAVTS